MALRKEDLYDRDAAVYQFPARAGRARRRRSLVRGGALTVVLGLVVGIVMAAGGGAPGSRPGAPRAVVVHSGETLWSIAGRYAENGADPRAYVDAVMRLNHLRAGPQEGMRLRLPR